MEPNTKLIIDRFINTAKEIIGEDFDKHLNDVGMNFRINQQDDDTYSMEFDLPDKTRMKSFILTLRMFTQENESIAFPNIHSILNDKSLSEDLKNRIKNIRRAYFKYLNSHSEYTVELFEGHPTRMDILKTVMYGGMAHVNDEKTIKRFQTWTQDEIRESLLLQEFSSILNQLLVLIKEMSKAFENELKANA